MEEEIKKVINPNGMTSLNALHDLNVIKDNKVNNKNNTKGNNKKSESTQEEKDNGK